MINLSTLSDPVHHDALSDYLGSMHIELRAFGSWRKSEQKNIEVVTSEFELTYIQHGSLKITSPSGEFYCNDHMLFLFEPFVPYIVEKNCDYNMDIFNIFFEIYPQYRHHEFVEHLIHRDAPYFHTQNFPAIEYLFQDVFALSRHSSLGQKTMVDSMLKVILSYMAIIRAKTASELPVEYEPFHSTANDVVRRAIQLFSQSLESPIQIKAICVKLSISQGLLYKSFLRIVKVSPQTYFLQYKMLIAKNMMQYEGKSVSQCAHDLGFSSPYHLSSNFKKIFGKSPTHYLQDQFSVTRVSRKNNYKKDASGDSATQE